MATLGIELSDVGVHCVLLGDDGSSRALNLGEGNERFPAYVHAHENELIFGSRAQEVAQVYPRRVNSEFIDDLSFQGTRLDRYPGRLTYSKLAYEYFSNLTDAIRRDVDDIDRVIVGAPGHFLESNDTSERRLGLLLGILKDLNLPLAGIVDMAAASLYSEGLWNVPEGQSIFHVDMLLHATHISVFHKQNGLERVHFSRLPQHGFSKMLERFSGALANRFLEQTSFDITADRDIEKAFHAQTCDMLFHLERVGEASLEVSTRDKSRQMSISKENVAIDLAPQVKLLTQMLLRAINDFAVNTDSIQIMLSDRAAAIQGLKDSIVSQGLGNVQELPHESGAFGAANYGKSWAPATEIEEIRVETGITLEGLRGVQSEDRSVSFALGSINVVKKGKSLAPTHIVCDGLAYELSENGFVFGVGESEAFDLVVDRNAASKSFELGRLVLQDDKWLLVESSRSSLDSKSVGGLKAGDCLELSIQGRRKQLLLIHCIV